MKRRHFIKNTVGGVVLPSLLSGFGVKAFGASPFAHVLNNLTTETDHVLVMIQLSGGNDGLNTVIPLDQFANLTNNRANVLVPETSVLPLNGYAQNGLHPAMTGMQQLFNDGKMQIIQSVGYPDQDFSHFRSTDIWMSASDSTQVVNSGWAGRYLSYEYPNFPTGYPNTTMPDPLAIEIAYSPSLAFMGPSSGMSVSVSDPTSFYNLVNGIQTPVPNTHAGEQLAYVRLIADQAEAYGGAITTAYNNNAQQLAYPAGNDLAEKLKIIAKLIAGGLKTRIYMVSIGGFDTHDSQVVPADHTTGEHADLLKELSDAVKAFMDDCRHLNIHERVMGMTFSEFGRRILSNGSDGTDHGAAAPMFLFGEYVQSGILGTNPLIPAAATTDDNIPMQYDFRSVYATVLKEWFCVPEADLQTILFQNFQSLPIINSPSCISSIHEVNAVAGESILSNSPNPFTGITTLDFKTKGGYTMIQIFNTEGKLVGVPVSGNYAAGTHTTYWNSEDLPAGIYYARLQNGVDQQVRTMFKAQ